jgi:ketosteroid isomerase-like protein
MHMLKGAALVAAGLLALAGCAPSAPDAGNTKADEDAMRQGTEAWVAAYSKGDVDAILALYAEDAVVMPPGVPAATNRDALRDFLTTDIATSAGTTLELGASSSGVSGNIGWHAGAFTVKDTSGNAVGAGKYLEVWRKQDGKWLILRDTWNLDAPPASPSMPAAPPAS